MCSLISLIILGSEIDKNRNVITLGDVIELGKGVPVSDLDKIEEEQFVNEACMLIFTSGTTGQPKGTEIQNGDTGLFGYNLGRQVGLGVTSFHLFACGMILMSTRMHKLLL